MLLVWFQRRVKTFACLDCFAVAARRDKIRSHKIGRALASTVGAWSLARSCERLLVHPGVTVVFQNSADLLMDCLPVLQRRPLFGSLESGRYFVLYWASGICTPYSWVQRLCRGIRVQSPSSRGKLIKLGPTIDNLAHLTPGNGSESSRFQCADLPLDFAISSLQTSTYTALVVASTFMAGFSNKSVWDLPANDRRKFTLGCAFECRDETKARLLT